MKRFIFLFLLISTLLCSNQSLAKSNPCPKGKSYIILQSAKTGYVCVNENTANMLQGMLSYYKGRLQNGEDIITILTELRANLNTPKPWDPDGNLYDAIMLDRIKAYAEKLCSEGEKNTPTLHIPKNQIYDGYSLMPVCSYTPPAGQTTFMKISVYWKDSDGNMRTYSGSGGTFSGTTLKITGNGKHTVECGYRLNVCVRGGNIKKDILIQGGIQQQAETHSIARAWNEVVLDAIRKDRVRPPVQARNLFHISAAMYDAWRIYHTENSPYLFGRVDKSVPASCRVKIERVDTSLENEKRTISYAAYRIVENRYKESPGYESTLHEAKDLMNSMGFSVNDTTSRLSKTPTPNEIGNAIAKCYLDFGQKDGSNEAGKSEVGEGGSHANQFYTPINPPLAVSATGGNTTLIDWNRWQPLSVGTFVDQAGNAIPGGAATFIGAEWGNVIPFALEKNEKKIHTRDGHTYTTYLDPGAPPQLTSGEVTLSESSSLYKWNFELVSLWSSHLDPRDNVMIDISPLYLGNAAPLPENFTTMKDFYDMKNGGVKTLGYPTNPKTGKPYESQIVKRGDYTRAIAEFWADGPKSETPPGHWFTILNAVSDTMSEKRWEGNGPILNNLEWDIKSYFTLGGGLHDAAIAAWGIKGAYDGIRPVSVIRALATKGQSSSPEKKNYNIHGFDLIPGYIEEVQAGDPLEGKNGINRGKIKIKAWKGPQYVIDPNTDFAGVDWILAENWWPYQRSSFVTPPFAGYVSGHSTFSRAAAEILTDITGDEFFPGGLMKWPLKARDYLVFEQGPSADITLEWATYRDAANESALSRIWGGIHPPMDDIPGRIIGEKVGKQAANFVKRYFH